MWKNLLKGLIQTVLFLPGNGIKDARGEGNATEGSFNGTAACHGKYTKSIYLLYCVNKKKKGE